MLIFILISTLNTAIAYYIVTKFKKPIFKSGYFWSIFFYLSTVIYLDITNQLKNLDTILGLSLGLILSILSIKVIIPLIILLITRLFFKKRL